MRQRKKSKDIRRQKLLRIPEGTFLKIEAAAKREQRSVQGQILYYVELALADGRAA